VLSMGCGGQYLRTLDGEMTRMPVARGR
jgi:hypothetical protein